MVARRQRFSQRVRRREYGNISSPLTPIKTGRDFAFYVVAPTSGVEDYLAEGETRTYWWGQAAAAVGLAGEVQAEALEGTAKKASTVTRDLKDETETKAQKIRRWRAEAQQLGFDPDDVAAAVLGRVDRAQAGELLEDGQGIGSSWDDTAEAIATAVDERLTDELATWDRIKWVATAAEVAPDWLSGERLHWIADQELADQELGGRVGSRAVRRAATDRRGSPGSERWTTRDNLAMERASLRRVIAAYKAADGARVTEAAALAAAETAELGTEQTGVLVDLAASGRRFGAVVGPAGSGKTRTLQALGQAAEQAGIPIRAMAEAQRAADGLAGGLGVDDEHSENITRFLNHDEADDEGGWWVVDEASMVKTRHWAELTRRAQQTGATIIAVGDPHQLPAVGAGGMFEAFLNHGEVTDHRLGIVWRMREAWERDASLQLRAGDPDAVDDYADRGRVLSLDDFGPVLDEFAQAALDGEEILVTAHSNAAVDQLNDALQARIVGPRDPDTEYVLRWDDDGGQPRERRIGAGDLIRTRKNWWEGRTSRGRAVVNGATWTVTASTPEGLWVESPERGHVLLAPHYLTDRLENGRPTVEHGWAATVHSAQGRTVDRAATIIGPGTGSELLYVGLTRGRSVNLVAGPGTATEVAEMARGAAVRPSRHLPAIAHRPAPSQQPTAPEEPTHMRSATTQRPTAPTAVTDQTDDKADQARAEREQAEQERRRQTKRAAIRWVQNVADAQLAREEQERRRQAERERAAALQLVEALAGMDPEDARAVLAQQLGDSRWRREASAALQQQQEREQAARELAEREAAEAASWLDGLPDRADPEEIGAAAAEWWSTVDAEALTDAYLQEQQERAAIWAATVEGGHHPQAVVDVATQQWLVADPEQVAASYTDASRRRVAAGDGWLDEHGSRRDDDQQEDSRAEAVAKFGIIPEHADKMVDAYDTRQRDAAAASVDDMDEGLTPVRQIQQVMNKWGDTRYIEDAIEALGERQEREKETQQRRRSGPSLGW